MTAVSRAADLSNSFVYEHLVSHVSNIQCTITDAINTLNLAPAHTVRLRSLTFIDPYGNSFKNQCKDHELVSDLIKGYKKNYIPKFLRRWIKIGRKVNNTIVQITDAEMNSTASIFEQGHELISYGEVFLWIGHHPNMLRSQVIMNVCLTDCIGTIEEQLKKNCKQLRKMEFRCTCLAHEGPPDSNDWNCATILNSNDTILSARLYVEGHMIIVKTCSNVAQSSSENFYIFAKTLTGRSIRLTVSDTMLIRSVKQLIEDSEGIPTDQQRLVFAGETLQDHNTIIAYGIRKESVIHIICNLRGGMYHVTSGRNDFNRLPSTVAESIRKILAFEWENLGNESLITLQSQVIEGRALLSNLSNEIKQFPDVYHAFDSKILCIARSNETEDTDSDSDNDV